jgi:hypothetical protein
LANEWLDFVLKNYQDTTVEAYLNDESIEIERVKEVANDRLVQIKLTFTMSAFTKCFRPVSHYPSDFADLKVWLKSDSGATFDIASKRVSAWADQSGNSNSVAQATAANQPLRYGYDGINDKAYLKFDGTNDSFISNNNSPITTEFTIFEVSKITNASGVVFGYTKVDSKIKMGLNASNQYAVHVSDDAGVEATTRTGSDNKDDAHIAILKKSGTRVTLEYYDASTSHTSSDIQGAFDTADTFNGEKFTVGLHASHYLNGELNELIIFNRALTDVEIADVKGYLNLKYRIY